MPIDLNSPEDARGWVGLEFEVAAAPGAGAPALHVEYAPQGYFRVRNDARTALMARMQGRFAGLWWTRAPGEPTSLGVIPPIRATEARHIAGDLRGWAWSFHNALRESATPLLYPGTWRIEPAPVAEPSLGDYPLTRRLEQCLSHSGGFSNWGLDGIGDVFALREPSPPEAARVKAWRKPAREGTLPPVLLLFVSGMDSWLLVDGHDRLQAALLEGVTPAILSISSIVVRRWQPDADATARIERSLQRQAQHATRPQQIDSMNRRLITLYAEPSQVVPKTRAWPIPKGREGWLAEARELVAAGAPAELCAG